MRRTARLKALEHKGDGGVVEDSDLPAGPKTKMP